MKFAQKKDSAVSPVIGTILLVAITVILVAIIAAVVMPMVGGTSGAATIGVQVVPSETTKTIDVTFTGGDYAKITKLYAVFDGTKGTEKTIDSSSAIVIGVPVNLGTAAETGMQTVKVVAIVNGNEQIIYDGKLTLN
ncbi:MAG TPA: type IV pilin N-terminal domain-containing protein [Methanocorpusculum sp.]|nr:type IV pilin N-terminal domain-containing protein [Methanocorpusculum sp.]